MVRRGVQEKRFKSGEQREVLRREEGAVIVGKDGVVAIGHRIRFTKTVKHRGQKFLNNELRTVVSINDGKIIFDNGEIVRNSAALHLDQGIAVTSHASQA